MNGVFRIHNQGPISLGRLPPGKKESLMKTKKKIILALAVVIVIAAFVVYSKVVKPIPPDKDGAVERTFDNLMGSRYTEILLVFGNGLTKKVTAGVDNTMGLNGSKPEGGGDSCPAALVDNLDLAKLKEDHAALKVIKNGPRLWTVDHVVGKLGKERDFQGLKAHWVMWFPIPESILKGSMENPYGVMHALRDTTMVIRKGSRAYILDDPQGTTWVMKSASLIADPNQKFEDLQNLGSRLKLPSGWKFRSPILEQDLVFMSDHGKAQITQDDLGNTYDRMGGPYSNYKP
jgi:hypothetical protein